MESNTLPSDIKDYLHLYLKCEAVDHEGWKTTVEWADLGYPDQIDKLILRPLSDLTVDEFKEFTKPKSFAIHGGYWYACEVEVDPEFEGDMIQHIQDCCDDEPENVTMLEIRSKQISFGWISYEETHHAFSTKEHAVWVAFLLSKGFDLFGLIDAGLAIDKTTLKP